MLTGVTVTPTGLSVTVAVADFVASASEVALTVIVCRPEIVPGAVYKPEAEMLPEAGLSDQVTPVLDEPATVAMNCWVWLALRVTLDGETDTDTVPVGLSVTVAVANFVPSALDVALAVIVC